ncbi:cold shock DNA-binding domain-containing protein [Catenovulum agarivorans DS-2]|uniref:Cold shock DNA-binding domain-containing protein n=1 Tax=Catenovulum agarivorans DS-2 TaxID=1328313 RepID=W7QAE4_9ALTE|nr:DUF1294 domain-containing protein [Catenovulum agarivorans]EWH08981.1 cold shock DNA-binding domain-containing protein [Catenovulum agarivorans DS-2]
MNYQGSRFKTRKFESMITIAFIMSLIFMVFTNKLPIEILYFYAGLSVFAFLLYAVDKSAAQNNRWRTPERHLHLISLLGGWIGAFCAQNMLRHKSKKREFKLIYRVTVAINICILGWLLGEQGQQFLHSILASLE